MQMQRKKIEEGRCLSDKERGRAAAGFYPLVEQLLALAFVQHGKRQVSGIARPALAPGALHFPRKSEPAAGEQYVECRALFVVQRCTRDNLVKRAIGLARTNQAAQRGLEAVERHDQATARTARLRERQSSQMARARSSSRNIAATPTLGT